MFKNLINVLKKPQLSFLRIKDKTRKSFLYILLLTVIMTTPVFVLAGLNKTELILNQQRLNQVVVNNDLRSLEIVEGKLINDKNHVSIDYVGNVAIIFGNIKPNITGYLIVFEEESINTYMSLGLNSTVLVTKSLYSDLGYRNFDFNNSSQVISLINKTAQSDGSLLTFKVLEHFFTNFFDLIFTILLLSILAKIFTNLPISFKEHFNINTYVATSYAIVFLMLSLFGLMQLSIIAIIVAYIYQTIAYRSVRIVSNMRTGK